MKVRLYSGSLRIVEKSGVGQALHHQEEMLKSVGVEVVYKNERDAALVHINTVFPDSVLAALAARLRGQRVICYGHSTEEDFRNSFRFSNFAAPLFRRWICFCYSLGDVVITPTGYSRELLMEYGIKKPVYALSNGVDTGFFRPEKKAGKVFREKYQLGERDRAVVSVGHYIERKGILDFIEMARRMPETRFFWFGYTNLNLIPGKIRRATKKAPANLVFPGYVSREELREAYCGSDLFCFMSYEETEGIVVLEALACGIPVLVRDISVYRGWLEDGGNVYKSCDLESFCGKAEKILEGQAVDLTGAGRRTAESRSVFEVGKKLLRIYRAIERREDRIVVTQ